MIRTQLGLVLLAGTLLTEACPPSPSPPRPDASDASPPPADAATGPGIADSGKPPSSCTLACDNLRALACPEGLAGSCAATCEHAETARLTSLHPECLAKATTKAAARACRSVTCP